MYKGTHLENFMHTKHVGDIAELAVSLRALKKGWSVSKPLGDNQRYDLILDDSNRLIKVQCKSAKLSGNIVSASLSRITKIKDKYKKQKYTESEVDAFALYCPDNDVCYLVNFSDISISGVSQGDITLRIQKSTANNQYEARMAEDYVF